MRDYIPIEKNLIPYSFNILLADEWFELLFQHNKAADMITVSLYKDDELIASEPMILNVPLFQDIYQPGRFPAITLTPYAPGGDAKAVTFESLGQTVFLSVDDEEGDTDG